MSLLLKTFRHSKLRDSFTFPDEFLLVPKNGHEVKTIIFKNADCNASIMTTISSDESLTYANLAFADSLDMKQSINFTLVFCISNSSWNLTSGFN